MFRRAIGRILAFLPGLVFLAPALALLPAAVFDIGPGPDSRPRFSLFPLALAALDPLVWTSLWNSLAVATLATAGSLAIGVAAGDILARSRFWGRPVFSAAITALAVVIPAWSALGFLGLFGTFGPVSFQRVFSSIAQTQGDTAHVWPWLVWVASALIQGVALVAVAARSAHVYVNSYDQDAARLAGARPLRIWWTFTWPALRPSVVSAAYLVFMINLADPAAPLVLGLRRTLGFQIVVTALGPDPFPRLAGIALMVLAVNLPGSLLVRWRRGADLEPDFASRSQQGTEVPSSRLAAGPRAVLYCVWLGCGSLLAWLPVAGLVRMGLAASSTVEPVHLAEKLGISDLLRRLTTDPRPAARTFRSARHGHCGDARPADLAAAWPPGSTQSECHRFAHRSDPSAGDWCEYTGAGANGPARVAIFDDHTRMAACRSLDGTHCHCVYPHVLARFSGFRGRLPGLSASKIDPAGRAAGARSGDIPAD